MKNYDLYYDYNIIAAGSRHGLHVAEHVPEWWGIITVEEIGGKLDFYFLRRPKANAKVDAKKKLSILWRPELARILKINGLPRYQEKSKEFVQRKLLEKIPETILWQQVCEELFQRDYNTIDDEIRRFRSGRMDRRKNKSRLRGPVQAIDPAQFIADSKTCISCMRCIKLCPRNARKVNGLMVSAAALAIKKACSVRKENELFL